MDEFCSSAFFYLIFSIQEVTKRMKDGAKKIKE